MFARDRVDNGMMIQADFHHISRFRIIIFYVFMLFVLIRIWIFVVAANSTPILVVCSILTFFILVCWFRWRQRRLNAEREAEHFNLDERRNADILVLLHSQIVFRGMHGNLPPHNGLPPSVISRLKTIAYADEGFDGSCGIDMRESNTEHSADLSPIELGTTCSICLSDYTKGEILTLLPCFHGFHKPCVDEWLHRQDTCPLCKQKVVINPNIDTTLGALASSSTQEMEQVMGSSLQAMSSQESSQQDLDSRSTETLQNRPMSSIAGGAAISASAPSLSSRISGPSSEPLTPLDTSLAELEAGEASRHRESSLINQPSE